MFTASLLPSARLLALCAVLVSAASTSPSRASAQSVEPPPTSPGPTRYEMTEGDRLALARPMLRARRTVRAGVTMMAVGSAGVLASALVLASIDERSCPGHDPFCENGWARAMGAFTGIAVGTLVVTSGAVTFGVGAARRNRLGRISDVAFGVAPTHLDLRLRF